MRRAGIYLLTVLGLFLPGCRLLPSAGPFPSANRDTAEREAGPALLLRGASVMTAVGPTLTTGDVLIRGGRIVAVAPALDPPAEARIVDLSGRWVTPGLIDPHSHLGVNALPRTRAHSDVNEKMRSLQAAVRAEEGFWPQDPMIRRAVAGGVTPDLLSRIDPIGAGFSAIVKSGFAGTAMPGFSDYLDDDEIEAIRIYLMLMAQQSAN